ncbi:MAG: RNase adapter RapZ [Betaproteobacteria bacterium]|nr:MAG: RNase adapter RapZ [Betaproteobacteria bacterium]
MQLVIITGLSGSGKSIALKVLEDSGYYCVDNLPAQLLRETVDFLRNSGTQRVAISIDVRSGSSLVHLPELLEQMKSSDLETHIVFLDSKAETLVKRFSETRRRHPLAEDDRTLIESIQLERELLEKVGTLGHRIDTSDLNPNALRNWVRDLLDLDDSELVLLFQSFGFKHGIPLDADFVFDVRCLPNPHYDPKLRDFTGRDSQVVTFLEANADVEDMREHIRTFVERWLPCFVRDNRNYLTVAIGCTGGRHRSVYLAERLAEYFGKERQVLVRHRELAE